MAKVMLVEDDNNLREIYEARLQAEGYTIVSAHDGEEALVVAKAEKPDLIISDVMMPKISGFEMLDILRNTDGLKDVRIIMLTALGQADDQQRADKLGADRYLVKSQVTLEDIVKSAQELLGEGAPAATTPPAAQPLNGTDTPGSSVASAAPTPTSPAPATPVPPAIPVASPPEPTAAPAAGKPSAPPVANDKTAVDDKVMADAVDALVADTEKKKETKPAAETEKTVQPDTADEETETGEKPADEPAPSSQEDSAGETDPANGHVKIANKKVISPIDTGPGKDIHALLAEEEAKEAGQTPGATAEPSLAAAEAEVKHDAINSAAQETAGMEAKIEDFVAGATSEPDAPAATPPIPATPQADTTPSQSAVTDSDTTKATPAISSEKAGTPATAPSTTPTVTPIVITEDAPSGAPAASLSGNPGAPAAAPASGTKAPTDPNNIAL